MYDTAWKRVFYKIFRNGENGHKNSQNVETYDGNFMGHIRTDCTVGYFMSTENFKTSHFSLGDLYIFFETQQK